LLLLLQPSQGRSDDDLPGPSKEVGSSSLKTTSESPDAVADVSQPGGLEYDAKMEPLPSQEETKDLVRFSIHLV
jgi:hypothetical protein